MKLINNTFLSHSWKKNKQANAIGRSAKTVREFLEKNYTEEAIAGDNETIKLAIKALLEVMLNFEFAHFVWYSSKFSISRYSNDKLLF